MSAATFQLDHETADAVERLASRWNVSPAEVIRRAVSSAGQSADYDPDIESRLAAARRLQASLQGRNVDVDAWIAQARDSRR